MTLKTPQHMSIMYGGLESYVHMSQGLTERLIDVVTCGS